MSSIGEESAEAVKERLMLLGDVGDALSREEEEDWGNPEAESVWSGPRNDAPVGLQFRNPENRTEEVQRVQVFLGLICYFLWFECCEKTQWFPAKMCCFCLVITLCMTPCDPMDGSALGSSVHGISQARIVESVAISFSRGSSWPRDGTHHFCTGRWVLHHQAIRKGQQRCDMIPAVAGKDPWVLMDWNGGKKALLGGQKGNSLNYPSKM